MVKKLVQPERTASTALNELTAIQGIASAFPDAAATCHLASGSGLRLMPIDIICIYDHIGGLSSLLLCDVGVQAFTGRNVCAIFKLFSHPDE
ncbi:MAG: hypothetical protein EOP84_13715 [Verrucomicrobiaceae bacterium]|nr:MAG: hypothetical protein EOP84_13715 [Verrucomicrobiaceae bacterium]